MAMRTSDLLCHINCDGVLRGNVKGVYPANRIPQILKIGVIIVNTDSDDQPGTHWCAIYFRGDGRAEFFDSYGNPPGFYNNYFVQCLLRNSKSYVYNAERLQTNGSNVCGQYCLFYLMLRLRGKTMRDIVTQFRDYPNNDYYVYDFIAKTFPCCVSYYPCTVNQSCKNKTWCNLCLLLLLLNVPM